jgi:hypothetical protein
MNLPPQMIDGMTLPQFRACFNGFLRGKGITPRGDGPSRSDLDRALADEAKRATTH